MKTWPNALKAHKKVITWCMSFSEVLLALEQAGAPPPDQLGAAHADWATTEGVCRIAKSIGDSGVALAPFTQVRRAQELPPRATVETLAEVIPQWAAYLNRVYLAEAVPSDKTETYEIRDDGLLANDLLAARPGPYWTPAR